MSGKDREQISGLLGELECARRRIAELEARLEERPVDEERELELTLDATTDGIWKWHLLDGVLFFSPRYYEMLGYSPGEFRPTYEEWSSRIHPDDTAKALAVAEKYLENTPDIYENTFRMMAKDGSFRWIKAQARVVERDASGRAVRLIGNHQDVTEIRAAEERYALLFNTIGNGVAFYRAVEGGEDFVFIDINEAGAALSNAHREDLIGRTLSETFPSSVEIGLNEALRRALATGEIIHLPLAHYHDDRHSVWVENHIYRVDSERVIAVFEDTTKRKLAEEGRRKSEEKAAGLMRAITDSIAVIDRSLTITWSNDVARHEIGDIVGKKCFEAFCGEASMCPGCHVKETFDSGRTTSHESHIVSRDGGKRAFWCTASVAETDAAGEVQQVVEICRDITEMREAEAERLLLQKQLHHAQKMEAIGRLAGGIAHDFNNLLTGINGNAALALLDVKADDPIAESLQEIQQGSQRAAKLTKQLLAFSRQQIIETKVFSVNQLLRGLQRLVERVIGEDIATEWRLTAQGDRVEADPGQIEQVVVNMVVNARDAMPKGGTLSIATGEVRVSEGDLLAEELSLGPYVRIEIRDTGEGMDEGTAGRVFEPFFTTKEEGRGTGFGLSTAFGIVRQHKGHIDVHTELGWGSTFTVFLPQVDRPVEIRDARASRIDLPRGTERVLFVEDDDIVRSIGRKILTKLGYDVCCASSGHEALAIFDSAEEGFDLLLTDVIMPEMNGRELALRLTRDDAELKTLFVSGYASDVMEMHGIDDAKVEFIAKPYTPQALARSIREVLDSD